jgi:hypothetical protein
MIDFPDALRLLHPAIAVSVVFPIIGIVVRMAWQTRQRRLEVAQQGKSKIPPVVGSEHVKIGRWLTGSVVGLALLGLAHPIFKKLIKAGALNNDPSRVGLIALLFLATIATLVLLFMARERLWRAVFATLTGMGLVILGFQTDAQGNPLVFRRDNEWFVSHFYYGLAAALLMIFSLAIVQEIYQDRTNRWRTVHIMLNSLATLLFIGQGITGVRDLLEIPLSWQEPYIFSCDYVNKKCPEPAKQSQLLEPASQSQIPEPLLAPAMRGDRT